MNSGNKNFLDRRQSVEILKAADVKISEQRILIYSFLYNHRIHPTAERIYRELSPDHPSLSLTTVYNTMKLFEASGLLTVLPIEDTELRYDVNTSFHAHFKCSDCKEIFDVPFSEEKLKDITFFKIERISLNFYGFCPDCLKKN